MEGLFPIFVVAIVKRRRDEQLPARGGEGVTRLTAFEVPPKKRGVGENEGTLSSPPDQDLESLVVLSYLE